MGPLSSLDWTAVAALAAASFVAAAGIVTVAAHFPRGSAPESGRGALGSSLVWLAVGGLAALVLGGAAAVHRDAAPTNVAIVVSGLAVLAAPFAVEPLPRRWRDGRAGLAGVIALSLAALAALPST
jgi:hypothetical protein